MKKMNETVLVAEVIDRVVSTDVAMNYGRNCDDVMTSQKTYKDADLRHVSWQFTVKDSKLGVKAVAMALGNGMANLSQYDDDAASYGSYGVKFTENNSPRYHQPNLFLSPESSGYRLVWGGVDDTCDGYLVTNDMADWTVDIYKLRPNLPNGGVLVQSGNSAAFVVAEKKEEFWTVTLTMPVLPSGQLVGSVYRSNFRRAWNWYQRQIEKK